MCVSTCEKLYLSCCLELSQRHWQITRQLKSTGAKELRGGASSASMHAIYSQSLLLWRVLGLSLASQMALSVSSMICWQGWVRVSMPSSSRRRHRTDGGNLTIIRRTGLRFYTISRSVLRLFNCFGSKYLLLKTCRNAKFMATVAKFVIGAICPRRCSAQSVVDAVVSHIPVRDLRSAWHTNLCWN